jgi:16S rRNA (guanine966-N2)-methyltransferase
MRIISGKFRGRKLQGPRGLDLRPTSDRLKQTLYDIMAAAVPGATILDVFAGTGAIGLEGLSRGARETVFIDSSRDAARLIRHNLDSCGIASGYRILLGDVFSSLRTLAREDFRADIIFLDPPYNWGPYGDLVEILFRTGIAFDESRVVVEHHRKVPLPEEGKGFRRVRTVQQSDKCLSFYQKAAPTAMLDE